MTRTVRPSNVTLLPALPDITIFAQPDREHIEKQFGEVTTMLGRSHPKVTAMLIDAQPDLLAFAAFPVGTGARSG